MNLAVERAKSSWLLAFGDVVTLLITFFIMAIVLNKGEITKIQKWVDQQITASYQLLEQDIKNDQFKMIEIERSARGIVLSIQSDNAFQSGSFTPTQQLNSELTALAKMLVKAPLLNIEQTEKNRLIVERAKEEGMQWLAEIVVEGHTDNDPINPLSRLRNNFFLSTLRAQAVMNVLFEKSGLAAELFSVTGYGEWQPIADNATVRGKRLNRRVEIILNASFQKVLD